MKMCITYWKIRIFTLIFSSIPKFFFKIDVLTETETKEKYLQVLNTSEQNR